MKTQAFANRMGQVITVSEIVVGDHVEQKDGEEIVAVRREIKRIALLIPRAGWIVGVARLQTGLLKHERHGEYGEESLRYLGDIVTVQCWKVVFWPTMNPVLVEGINAYNTGGTPIPPSKYAWLVYVKTTSEDDVRVLRGALSNGAREQKRLPNGRFVSSNRYKI